MLHVKKIREIVDEGQSEKAHSALDQLLALGPNNLEGLKLRAHLYAFEGRFAEEAQIWDKVATIDREDPDAINFLLQRQMEDREHFYFTDDVPGGGRRFSAHPKRLMHASALGFVGCLAFLLITRLAVDIPIFAEAEVVLGFFAVLVMVPWVLIVVTYLSSIRSVTVSSHGISVHTRLRRQELAWSEVDKVCMARAWRKNAHDLLSLVVLPRDSQKSPLEIDLNLHTSPIRARSYLVREVARAFAEPEYTRRDSLALDRRRKA